MNEQEWLMSEDPVKPDFFFRAEGIPPTSERKLRLFACGCCRQVWDRLTDNVLCQMCGGDGIKLGPWGSPSLRQFRPPVGTATNCSYCSGTGRVNLSRHAVEVAERFADGEATDAEIKLASRRQRNAWNVAEADVQSVNIATYCLYFINADDCVAAVLNNLAVQGIGEPAVQAALLREIVGNPFRPVTLPKATRVVACGPWVVEGFAIDTEFQEFCPWLTSTVLAIARKIYDECCFEDMPILADALEDAGCDNAEILAHCRGMETCPTCQGKGTISVPCDPDQHPWRTDIGMCEHCGDGKEPGSGLIALRGPHVRGCWVVDLLLSKR